MSELKPGQSLTPEQVRSLPDGAAIEAVLLDGIRYDVEVNSSIRRLAEGFLTTAQWKDCTLAFLPPAPSEPTMPDFDPHGLPEANNEIISKKLGQSPENSTEPSPGEGYRWVNIGETVARGDQREASPKGNGWFDTGAIGCVCDEPNKYRRRIEPQADPDADKVLCRFCHKPTIDNIHALCGPYSGIDYAQEPTPRASSEIEREASPIAQRAARALCDATLADIVDTAQPNGIDSMYGEIAALCHDYLRFHSYAKSIGAIE